MKKMSIVGGGFAGMTLAWHLAKRGFAVDLYEKMGRLGGMINTLQGPYGMIETAANGIMISENVNQLIQEIEADIVGMKSESKKRFIYRESPQRWPLSFFESIQLGWAVLIGLLKGKIKFKPRASETVKQWGLRNLTEPATEFLLAPALQGIYAGDIAKMSASLIFGKMFSAGKKKRYRGMLSGRHGMADIVQALEKSLRKMNVQIHLNSTVKISELQTPSVLASGLVSSRELLRELHPEVASLLDQIETAPIITITTFWDQKPTKYRGFGVLIPLRYGLKALGILRNSFIFPGRDEKHSETTIFGGPFQALISELSDRDLVIQAGAERKKIFQDEATLLHAHVTRWPQGLPQYNLSLEKVLQELKLPEGLYLHGNYLGGIGLTKILDRSEALASELARKYV
jgi:protoporphyrinogen/coproporphyrinogen III oxidase